MPSQSFRFPQRRHKSELELEFNPQNYDKAKFEYVFDPIPSRKYLVDTPVVIGGCGRHNTKRKYRWGSQEDIIKWSSSVPIDVPHPTLTEIYEMNIRPRDILNHPNITFLIDPRLSREQAMTTLSKYIPGTVELLREYINDVNRRISIVDAANGGIAKCKHETVVTFDIRLIEVAFKADTLVHDFRVDPKLPYGQPK